MSQVTAIITKIIMDEDYHVSFYDQYGYVVQTLQTDTYVEVVGSYLVCGSNGDSIKFYANTVELIEGPTFSQSYTPLASGFYQQGSQYFERLSAMYDYIKTNVVNVVVRDISALKFRDGSTQTTAATGGGGSGTVTSVGFTAGTGITVGGTNPITTSGTITITNTAPDQVVTLTEGTGIDVTGTYPNFTITNTQDVSGFVPYTGATADVDLGVHKLSADAVEFSLTPTNLPGAGQIAYDGATGSLSYLMNSSDVVCHIGQQLFAYVKNAEAVTITKGQPVYLYQASGNKATVKLAYNTSDAGSAKTLGLAAEDITSNQNGFVICQGVISGVNTGSYNEGDTLYLGAAAGTLTATKPYAPNHLVYIGVVEKANNGAGQIYVRAQNGYEMDELHNVDALNPNDKDGLFYNISTSLWEHKQISDVLGYTPGQGTVTSITTSAPLTGGTITTSGTIGIDQADATKGGYISATDWNKFNDKQDPITLTTTGTSGAATLVGSTLNIPQYSGGSGVSKSFLIGNHGSSTVTAGGTSYGGFVKNALTTVAGTFNVRTVMPSACVFRNWTINIGNQPASGSCVLTMRIDSVDTAYTLTIAAGSVLGVYQNTTSSLNVPAGSQIDYKITNNASATTGSIVAVSIQVEA